MYNTHLIKTRRSYSITEISALFRLNRQTLHRWLKYGGLKPIEKNTIPILVMGSDLRAFLKNKNIKHKMTLDKDQFYCTKCRNPTRAKIGSEEILKTGKKIGKNNADQLVKTAKCGVCHTKVYRYLGVSQKD